MIGISQPQPIFSEKKIITGLTRYCNMNRLIERLFFRFEGPNQLSIFLGFWKIGNIYTCLVLTVKGPHGFKCTYMGAHGFKMCLHSETFSFIEREMSQLPKYWVVSTTIGLTWDSYNICNSFKSKDTSDFKIHLYNEEKLIHIWHEKHFLLSYVDTIHIKTKLKIQLIGM